MMDLSGSLVRALRPLARLRQGDGKYFKYYYQKLRAGTHRGRDPADLWRDIVLIADLRPTDRVLDMGCAEGMVAFQVAKRVAHVDGVELESRRVREATRLAAEQRIGNVSFATGSVIDHPVEPRSYDVVMLLSVLGKPTESGHVGLAELERLLAAARRQIIVRMNVRKYSAERRSISLPEILAKMDECSFDGICFSRGDLWGNLIVGNRRGADARLGMVPPLVLIPTAHLRDHPCLRGAAIGSLGDFP